MLETLKSLPSFVRSKTLHDLVPVFASGPSVPALLFSPQRPGSLIQQACCLSSLLRFFHVHIYLFCPQVYFGVAPSSPPSGFTTLRNLHKTVLHIPAYIATLLVPCHAFAGAPNSLPLCISRHLQRAWT